MKRQEYRLIFARPALALLVALLLLLHWSSGTAANPIESFVGVYEGESVDDPMGVLSPKDIRVEIHRGDHGFSVGWYSTISKIGGLVRDYYEVTFVPTHCANIYAAAMRSDMFGHEVPLDPLRGEPYMWARIAGKTLTIYAMLITDSGAHSTAIE